MRVGIDIGGTFTDFTLTDEKTGNVWHRKVPTTPESPSLALVRGLEEILTVSGARIGDLEYLVHGTTIGLNTLLQRKGARLALIVCETNRNVLDLARLRLPPQFSFAPRPPNPLVPSEMVKGIQGRILADGSEYEPLSESEVLAIPAWLREIGADSCAIALLNSYVNRQHELHVASVIRQAFPSLPLSLSCEIWPEIREYERTMVTAMNAYIAPQMSEYFELLDQQLTEANCDALPLITRSNGGLMTLDEAQARPVETLLSGPASGVVGACFAAAAAGLADCVTFDMGGTSADISVITGGQASRSSEAHVGEFPIVIPAVEVHSVGAGGGSIAWSDGAGILKVGPLSAGAQPGPACYDSGGKRPTVTDAYLLCGFLNPSGFAGGRIQLNESLARMALRDLGQAIQLPPEETAVAILRVATATMAARVSPLLASLGVDARSVALLPYGGAGPVHACLLADELGISTILVPESPGTLCATGALINDLSRDWVRTRRCKVLEEELNSLSLELESLLAVAKEWFAAQPLDLESQEISFSLDMRYVGQAYEISVPIELEDVTSVETLTKLFHFRHEAIYRHSDWQAPIEIVNLRTRAIGRTSKPMFGVAAEISGVPQEQNTRVLKLERGSVSATVYQRAALKIGTILRGPTIIEQDDTTVVVLPDWVCVVDSARNLVLRKEESEKVNA